MDTRIDVAIVGGGVAGLSAALFLTRAEKSTVVFDEGKQRILTVDTVREFAGFDGLSPADMLARIRGEATRYGAEVRRTYVERVHPREDGAFDVLAGGSVAIAHALVLATGLIDVLPELNGLSDVWGREIGICPCFDGYERRETRFVVFGVPERLKQFASWVSIWSHDVKVVTPAPLDDEARLKFQALHLRKHLS
ncbi:MAG TPA: NAD(P)/FAD-dependent oxidoreductase [Candidatus Baltobacteraceae bacterium]|nr:NAD(P)/FAD-dependent oxidoreductase [Candidatus Baltobacteraceae bacterium]